MKRFGKFILMFLLVNMVAFNFTFAEPIESDQDGTNVEVAEESTDKKSGVPFAVNTVTIDTEKAEQKIEEVANKGESMAYKIVEQISDKSLPVCAILILWGAVVYFILGIRNLYKKRQGLLLMWGAFTFCVIAKIMNFVFWFAFIR